MKFTLPLGILILLLVVVAGRAYYTVDETEQVVITQFGAPVGETITKVAPEPAVAPPSPPTPAPAALPSGSSSEPSCSGRSR